MRKVTKIFEVYQFDELGEEEQTKALNSIIEILLETPYEFQPPNVKRAWDEAEEMQTPWFFREYIIEYAKDEVFEIARNNEYLKNGDMLD